MSAPSFNPPLHMSLIARTLLMVIGNDIKNHAVKYWTVCPQETGNQGLFAYHNGAKQVGISFSKVCFETFEKFQNFCSLTLDLRLPVQESGVQAQLLYYSKTARIDFSSKYIQMIHPLILYFSSFINLSTTKWLIEASLAKYANKGK